MSRCHTRLPSPETISQLSRCAESCLRCSVLVVLLGPPLIYHGGCRLVPEEVVGPPLVDTAVYQPLMSLQNLERDAEQWYGSVRLGVLRRFILLWEGHDGSTVPGLWELDLRKHDVKNKQSQAVV